MSEKTKTTGLRLRISPVAETLVRGGHPWVFAGSVRKQNRPGKAGELAVLYDRKDEFLAVGLFDPDSPIRVRILHVGKPQPIDPAWWRRRMEETLARRNGLFDENTTGWRCINGENDGWPGLVVDRYDTTLVLKLYSAVWLPRLREMVELLVPKEGQESDRTSGSILILVPTESGLERGVHAASPFTNRPANCLAPDSQTLKRPEGRAPGQCQDASEDACAPPQAEHRIVLRLSRNIAQTAAAEFGSADGQVLRGAPVSGPVVFRESGLRFEADVLRGQKTGFFLDQRENRRKVESLAAALEVLNLFSYSGGFSLYAARGGAVSVCDVDISQHALTGAQRNFALNQDVATVAACKREMIRADVFAWLRESAARRFDLIILDPPSLAKRESEREEAMRAYASLMAGAMNRLNDNGILVASSCSAHVAAADFFNVAREAARKSGRTFEELDVTGHPPDHAATFPEGHYLKTIYMRFT